MNRNDQSYQQDVQPSDHGERASPVQQSTAAGVLRFSVFEFDGAVPELRRAGRRVHLQEMPLRVLGMLLEHPNELVTREIFFARLWPHDRSGILDDNLNTAVRKLRLALTDSAHHPRFIETVPKRGYRFVGVVEETKTPALEASIAERVEPISDKSRWRVKSIVAVLVACAILTSAALLTQLDSGAPADPVQVRRDTVAVLPFINASGNADEEYFSDGLTEELIDRLARSGTLKVVSRTSSFAMKGKEVGAQEIAKMLGADALVEGTVRRSADRLRISIRLIDANDGLQLWSDVYDRRMDDVLNVQREIAVSIADTLTTRVLGASQNAESESLVADPVAYDSYLKGRFYWHRRTDDGLHAAVQHFEHAVERSPKYARAWAGLADAYAVLAFYDYIAPREAFPKAQTAARRALELDPHNASAEATLGYAALYHDWSLREAEEGFRNSIAMNPNDSKSHQWYGNLLTAAGRFEEAEREMRRAQQLEPLSLIASAAIGWVQYYAGRHEEALEQFRLTLALDADFELAYLWSGWALEALGRYDEAQHMFEEALARSNKNCISLASLARVQALRGDTAAARRTLAPLVQAKGYMPAYEIAKAWLALGERQQAYEWFRKAYDQRSHSLVFLRVDPQLEHHRNDAELQRLIVQVGFGAG